MSKGYALCIGLNKVDPMHYQGWDGRLNAPEKDAQDIQALTKSAGFSTDLIKGNMATKNNVITAIKNAAKNLTTGDMFVLYYSGHGGKLPDLDGDEDDKTDETWCLFDGQLMDDELRQLWTGFKEDVRILVLSDSCHSGTVIKLQTVANVYSDQAKKEMPAEISLTTYLHNKIVYDQYINEVDQAKNSNGEENIKANVRLISGCQDNQSSYDGTFNSSFTEALLKVWNGGKFSGNYKRFHAQIQNILPAHQSPNHFYIGKPNVVYDNQIPFSIGKTDKGYGKLLVDLSAIDMTSDQATLIDEAIQKAISGELMKAGGKQKIGLIPISKKRAGIGKGIRRGVVEQLN